MLDASDLLSLPPLLVSHFKEGPNIIEIHVELPRADPGACPHCGGRLVGNGTRLLRHRDLPLHGKPVLLKTERRRFLCRSCGKGPSEPLPSVFHPTRMMTMRLVDHVRLLAPTRSFRSLANELGLHEDSVAAILCDMAGSHRPFER